MFKNSGRLAKEVALILVCLFSFFTSSCGSELIEDDEPQFMGIPAPVFSEQEIKLNDGDSTGSADYIVAFKNDLPSGGLYIRGYQGEFRAHYRKIKEKIEPFDGVSSFNYLTSLDINDEKSDEWRPVIQSQMEHALFWGDKRPNIQGASLATIKFEHEWIAQKTLKKWLKQGKIWYAEPDENSRLSANEFTGISQIYERHLGRPWYEQIGLLDAFRELANYDVDVSKPPLIAVMDSGTDYNHPSLVKNIWENPSVSKSGCIDDFYGCNVTKSGRGVLGNGEVWPVFTTKPGEGCVSASDPQNCKHGTHVAGIIAAEPGSTENGFGGICPLCRIMTIKVVEKSKIKKTDVSLNDSSIISGFSYISKFIQNKNTAVRVVNASFGKPQKSRTVQLLIRLLRRTGNGTLVVAAAGNEYTMLRSYPAAFSDVISVANVDSETGLKNISSNYGQWVDISAPGSGPCDSGAGILSTIPGDGTECMTGTSMAAPIVSGVAGLLLLQQPKLSSKALAELILDSTEQWLYGEAENAPYIQLIKGNPVPMLGTGIVSASNAVKRVRPDHVANRLKERVSADACGTIGSERLTSSVSILFILLIPLFLCVVSWWRQRCRNLTS